jgi:hypothetical protein
VGQWQSNLTLLIWKQEYADCIDVQVKTIVLFVFSKNESPEVIKMHSEEIAKASIALILACPKEAIQSRKD